MTSNHNQDAFEFRFEGAVDEMHSRTIRGSNPSAKAWATIRAGLPKNIQRAETADPRATDADPAPVSRKTQRMRKESDVDTTLNPGMAAPPSRANRGWFAWAAIALVGVMIASTFFLNGQTPPGDDGNDLAWAPGLGTAESSVDLASPAASPPVYEYGPEYACEVEPLTADQVFDIVMNPTREFERRMGAERTATAERLEEGQTNQFKHYQQGRIDRDQYISADGTGTYEEIEDAANTFWNCMMTGTTYQMWALMNPFIVQHEILLQYPVLRDEETILAHIEEWGPRRYSANLYVAFEDLGNVDPIIATRTVSDEWDSVMITTDRETGDATSAIVVMQPHPDSGLDGLNSVEVSLMPTPDGDWWVGSINYPFHTGRG